MKGFVWLAVVACCVPKQSPPAPIVEAPSSREAVTAPVTTTLTPPAVDASPDTPTGAAAARDTELTTRAAVYFDAFVNMSPSFTPDGKRLLFLSNRDGLPQLYVADGLHGAATRVVATNQRITN